MNYQEMFENLRREAEEKAPKPPLNAEVLYKKLKADPSIAFYQLDRLKIVVDSMATTKADIAKIPGVPSLAKIVDIWEREIMDAGLALWFTRETALKIITTLLDPSCDEETKELLRKGLEVFK